ncbi:ABC-2 family transporter protein [Polymorphospora sp. NPDC051019]|uniref:ABC transporter permease n=1 Tax=Polymorphospora sp. NPDC051019 TaxID=3155725 RepID=UPI00341C782B
MRVLVKMVRLLGIGFSMSLRRTLAFRVDLHFDVMMSGISLASTLAAVLIIFGRTDHLGGWTRPEMFVLVGTFELLTGVKAAFVDPNLSLLANRGIREGRLDHHLLAPAPGLFLATLGTAAPLSCIHVLLGLGVVGVGVGMTGRAPEPVAVAVWLLLLLLGTAATWAVGTLIGCIAFWAPKLDLQSIYGTAWQFGRYPPDIYARPLRFLLSYVLPLMLVAAFPAAALLRSPDWTTVAAAAATATTAVLAALAAWRAGLRRYVGATS